MADESIRIELVLTKANTKKAFDDVETDAGKAGKGAGRNFGKNFKGSASGMLGEVGRSLGKKLAIFAVAAKGLQLFTRALREGVEASRQFNKATTEINTILPNQTKLTDKQKSALLALASTYGGNASKQAKAFYQTISAGITDTTVAFDVLREANKLSIGGIADLGSTVNVLTDIMNVYGGSLASASEATDGLFKTVQLGKTTVSELSTSLGDVINIAKNSGVTFDELNAALATLTTQGGSTAQRVTQLKSLFTAFAKNQKEINKVVDIGIIKTKGFGHFMQLLGERTGGSMEKLTALIPRVEGVQAVLGLTGDATTKFSKNLEEMEDKLGASGTAFRTVAQESDFKISKASGQIDLIGQKIGDSLLPALAAMAAGFSAVAEATLVDVDTTKTLGALKHETIALTKRQDELNKKLQRYNKWSSNFVEQIKTTKRELSDLTIVIKENSDAISAQKFLMAGVATQKFISNSQIESLLDARRSLVSLKEELENTKTITGSLSNAFTTLNSRSQIEISGDIDAAQKKIEILSGVMNALSNKNKKQASEAMAARATILGTLSESYQQQLLLEETRYLNEAALQKESLDRKNITQAEYNIASLVLSQNHAKAREKIIKSSGETVVASFGDNFKLIRKQAKETEIAINSHLGNGITSAVQLMVTNLQKGKNAFDEFGSMIMKSMGNAMTSIGQTLILSGLGINALTKLNGAAAVAAGIGLVAIGTVMSGSSGGESSGSGSGAGLSGGGGGFTESDSFDQNEAVNETPEIEREANTNVSINIQGDVLDSDESGVRIAEILNDAFDKQGVVINSKGVA